MNSRVLVFDSDGNGKGYNGGAVALVAGAAFLFCWLFGCYSGSSWEKYKANKKSVEARIRAEMEKGLNV